MTRIRPRAIRRTLFTIAPANGGYRMPSRRDVLRAGGLWGAAGVLGGGIVLAGRSAGLLEAQEPTLIDDRYDGYRSSPELIPGTERLVESDRITKHLSRICPDPRPIHGDLHHRQVVIGDEGIGLLDFDRAVIGDPCADLGNFVAHLERDVTCERISSAVSEQVRSSVLAGYQAHTARNVSTAVRWHASAAMVRLARHLIRRGDPQWPERTEALFNRAESFADASSSEVDD